MTWQGPDTDATREGSLCSRSNGMLNSVPKGQLPALNQSSCLQSQRPWLLSLPALLVHKLLVCGDRLGIEPNLRNLTHSAGSWSGQEARRGGAHPATTAPLQSSGKRRPLFRPNLGLQRETPKPPPPAGTGSRPSVIPVAPQE